LSYGCPHGCQARCLARSQARSAPFSPKSAGQPGTNGWRPSHSTCRFPHRALRKRDDRSTGARHGAWHRCGTHAHAGGGLGPLPREARGEGSRAGLPAGRAAVDRAVAAEPGQPARPAPGGGKPREGRGSVGRRGPRRPPCRRHRGSDRGARGYERREGGARAARRLPQRCGQAGPAEDRARQAGAADRARAPDAAAAPGDRVRDARLAQGRSCVNVGAAPPRALGRTRLPGTARRRAHPARRPHRLRSRRLRRDDERPAMAAGDDPRRGDRRVAPLCGHQSDPDAVDAFTAELAFEHPLSEPRPPESANPLAAAGPSPPALRAGCFRACAEASAPACRARSRARR
jgi:hypothetical protein